MAQQIKNQPQLLEDEDSSLPREYRRANIRVLATESLKNHLHATCKPQKVSVNDVVVRTLEKAIATGLLEEVILESIKARKALPSPGRPRENAA